MADIALNASHSLAHLKPHASVRHLWLALVTSQVWKQATAVMCLTIVSWHSDARLALARFRSSVVGDRMRRSGRRKNLSPNLGDAGVRDWSGGTQSSLILVSL